MEKENIKVYAEYSIRLLKCAMNGEMPEPVPEEIDLYNLMLYGREQTIGNIMYLPLSKLGFSAEELRFFKDLYNQAIFNDAAQEYYLEQVIGRLEEHHIPYMPMKGIIMKELYPSRDMRQSGDIDIFFDDEYSEQVKDIMTELGFRIGEYDRRSVHDLYLIEKNIKVEMHRSLISEKYSRWKEFCNEIAGSRYRADGYRYILSDEYYYIYMILHMAKHMLYGGFGIRFILDIWVYLGKYNDQLDWGFINNRLGESGLLEFENKCRELSNIWFGDAESNEALDELAQYIYSNSIFGTEENHILAHDLLIKGKDNVRPGRKLREYRNALFPKFSDMRSSYTVLNKLPVLLPFCWIFRIVKVCVFKKNKVSEFVTKQKKLSNEALTDMMDFQSGIGL